MKTVNQGVEETIKFTFNELKILAKLDTAREKAEKSKALARVDDTYTSKAKAFLEQWAAVVLDEPMGEGSEGLGGPEVQEVVDEQRQVEQQSADVPMEDFSDFEVVVECVESESL